jgi:hypothetical protein
VSKRLLGALGLAAAAAMVALVWSGTTYPGPGLYGDGAGYLGAAQSLAHHDGLRVPFAEYNSTDSTSVLAQWPPGFPAVLSVPVWAGAPPMTAVRIVQAAVGGCTVALTALMVATVTAPAWGAAAAVAMLVTPAIVAVHLNVVSEPLYLLCLACMLWAMVWRPGRPAMYGVAAAAAVLVRYLGVAAIAGAGVWAAVQPGSRSARARRIAIAIAPGLVVRALWTAYVRSAGGSERPLHVDHHAGAALRQLMGATAAWLAPWDLGTSARVIPYGAQVVFKVILGVAIVAAIVAEARGWRDARRSAERVAPEIGAIPAAGPTARLLAASALLVACHVAALLAARLLFSDVAFYDRVLAPVHYLLSVAVVALIASRWPGARSPVRLALAALGLVWMGGAAVTTDQLLRLATTVGLDHANVAERNGATIGWLRSHAAGEPIYTNEPAKIFFHLQRDSRSLPWVLDADTVQALERSLRARPGVVVWFTGGTAESFVSADLLPRAATAAKLEAALPLRAVARGSDGVVWELDPRVAR